MTMVGMVISGVPVRSEIAEALGNFFDTNVPHRMKRPGAPERQNRTLCAAGPLVTRHRREENIRQGDSCEDCYSVLLAVLRAPSLAGLRGVLEDGRDRIEVGRYGGAGCSRR